jgi:hypothetical protein
MVGRHYLKEPHEICDCNRTSISVRWIARYGELHRPKNCYYVEQMLDDNENDSVW